MNRLAVGVRLGMKGMKERESEGGGGARSKAGKSGIIGQMRFVWQRKNSRGSRVQGRRPVTLRCGAPNADGTTSAGPSSTRESGKRRSDPGHNGVCVWGGGIDTNAC
jgi:hypothetical protein